MADELISRQAAKEAVKYIPWCDWKAVGDCLDELPAVEVVRCKDCKHYHDFETHFDCAYGYGIDYPRPDDFCSYGERREENGT